MSAFGGSASTLASEVEQRTWQARPGLARLVRVAVALAPVAAATVVTRVMASLVPRPALPVEFGLWLLSMIGLATLVLVVVDRQARRLLPLAALLQLSLVFPDRAPSKFSLALRSGNIRRLTDADASFSSAGVYAAELLRLVIQLGRHDRFTRGHSERVRAYTAMIAGELGLTPSEANLLQWAALLHDVGKLGVPQTILNKPAPPDAAEWAVLRSHPGAGAHYLGPLREWLGEWAGAVDEHHERFDGTGYPRGLAGEDISFGGRIVAVADAYDVMTSTRAYKRPLSRMAARAELMRGSGSQFDPRVVRATLNASIGSMHWSAAVVTWLSQLQLLATQVPAASAAITASVAVGAAGTATLVDLPAWRAPVHEVAEAVVEGGRADAAPELLGRTDEGAAGGDGKAGPVADAAPGEARPGAGDGAAPEEREGAGSTSGQAIGTSVSTTTTRGQGAATGTTPSTGSAPTWPTTTSTSSATSTSTGSTTTTTAGPTTTTSTTTTATTTTPPPGPPTGLALAPDAATTEVGVDVWIDVLANDGDAARTLGYREVRIAVGPSSGSVDVKSSSLRFRPDAVGEFSFVYEVCDGEVCEQAVVTVTVTGSQKPTGSTGGPGTGSPGAGAGADTTGSGVSGSTGSGAQASRP